MFTENGHLGGYTASSANRYFRIVMYRITNLIDTYNCIGESEESLVANLALGEGANSFNTVDSDTACFNYTQTEDLVKEGLEVIVLSLDSTDPNVCFGRDSTLVRVPPNGG